MNNIPETLVDRWIARSVSEYRVADLYLKIHCVWASPVVGKYAIGGTKQIADGIKRSPATVENHAHGHWMYRELRKNGHKKRVRELWRSMPASFWWNAWDIHTKGYNSFYYINNADMNRWSVRDMMMEFKRDLESGTAPMIFSRALSTVSELGKEILQKAGLNDKEAKQALFHLNEFTRIVERK